MAIFAPNERMPSSATLLFRYREIDKVLPQPLFRHYQCTSQLIWIIHKTLTALISTAMVLFWSLSMPLAFRNLTNMEGPDVGITDAVFVSYHIRIMATVIVMSLQWSKAILASLLKQKGSLSSRNKVQLFFKTLPKAQRTRGLSLSCQSNFLRSYHKSWSHFIFRIPTKHQLKISINHQHLY